MHSKDLGSPNAHCCPQRPDRPREGAIIAARSGLAAVFTRWPRTRKCWVLNGPGRGQDSPSVSGASQARRRPFARGAPLTQGAEGKEGNGAKESQVPSQELKGRPCVSHVPGRGRDGTAEAAAGP